MSEQKNHWDGQPLPQGAFQEIEVQELDAVTGGVIEMPTPIGPNTYLYNARPAQRTRNTRGESRVSGTVTLITHDISIPDHTLVMSQQERGTVWRHTPMRQPNGNIYHNYDRID